FREHVGEATARVDLAGGGVEPRSRFRSHVHAQGLFHTLRIIDTGRFSCSSAPSRRYSSSRRPRASKESLLSLDHRLSDVQDKLFFLCVVGAAGHFESVILLVRDGKQVPERTPARGLAQL